MGRKIIDGAESVKIFGEDIAIRAKVYTTNGFSISRRPERASGVFSFSWALI
ncbi:MAG: hypothetical protein NZ526_06565 [Aquificaceae bacterium]|nr:hypothetical protein [Aquificaceae bacterium]